MSDLDFADLRTVELMEALRKAQAMTRESRARLVANLRRVANDTEHEDVLMRTAAAELADTVASFDDASAS